MLPSSLRPVFVVVALVGLSGIDSAVASACTNSPAPAAPASSSSLAILTGNVQDPSGAIIPGVQLQLLDTSNAPVATATSDDVGNFQIAPPRPGDYTLVVSLAGFQTVKMAIHAGRTSATPLIVQLPIAPVATQVTVNAESNVDLTDPATNADTSVLSADDLKALPVFDNDYVAAMSAFLDQGAVGTAGAGLMVDSVESNRATVSPSAVKEVRINQDPYSAQYYRPGHGQMEIISKPAADSYHGQFNFMFRDSALNAQNAFAPSKPFEQRRVYEGNVTGPIWHSSKTSFLASFNRAEEDLNAVVNATVVPTPDNPSGRYQANVPAPTRDTELSFRVGRQMTSRTSTYIQYSCQNASNRNQGVGNQTLPEAGYNTKYIEHDIILHNDTVYSANLLNQLSVVAEIDTNRSTNTSEAPKVNVQGNFTGGSAQNDSYATEYNLRLNDIVSWTKGRHQFRFGANLPHLGRRIFQDNTNSNGTYTFGPTYAADGNLVATALATYQFKLPSAFSMQTGQVRFVYHQQEAGGFFQDQIKVTPRFSLTPGVRYDWQNFLGDNKLSFAPRLSFALVLDPKSKTVLRGGGGLYYDRFGSQPLLDLARYRTAARRSLQISLDPATSPGTGCVPITLCANPATVPPVLNMLAPNAATPYSIQYGLSIERQMGERATATISAYSLRGDHLFRSVDVNAPTPESGYTVRPNPLYGRIRQMQPESTQIGNAVDASFRGRYNKYFSGFGHYTYSHYSSSTGGIGWYPQNQYEPTLGEWSNAGFDQRHRLGFYAMFNQQSIFNLSLGIFASTGTPWTITTGSDHYGDNLFNTRPDGVSRNTEKGPSNVGVDVRWAHDFRLRPTRQDKSPTLGFSIAAFNTLNHVNGSFVVTVQGSPDFGQVIAALPPRRLQLGMRYTF